MNEMISTPTEAYLPETKANFELQSLDTQEERKAAREELAEICETAFADDEIVQKAGVNFIRDMPNSMYYDKDNLIFTLNDEETGDIKGFSFLEKQDEETYYANITAVKTPNQGHGTQLITKTKAMLKQSGVAYLTIHVDKDKGFAQMLRSQGNVAETTERDELGQAPHQETLRIKL